MFNLDNIKLDEFDMFTYETETIMNSQMIGNGFNVGNKMNVGNDIFIKYYKIENQGNSKVVEKNVILQYKTKDNFIYILDSITKEMITRETEFSKYVEEE